MNQQRKNGSQCDDNISHHFFYRAECALLIHRFLHAMDEPYKKVFSLRVFGELPFEKIGLLFGKSSGWARVTFHRAKKQSLRIWRKSAMQKTNRNLIKDILPLYVDNIVSGDAKEPVEAHLETCET